MQFAIATSRPLQHLQAMVFCLVTALVTQPLVDRVDLANIVMLFLLTVVIVAVWLGQKPAVTASLASIALFDYLFVPPRFSFSVNNAQYLITFVVMLAVALIIGHLTNGLRQSAIDARQREQQTRALYALAQRLAGAVTVEQSILNVQDFVLTHQKLRMRVLLPTTHEALVPSADHPLSPTEVMVAKSVLLLYTDNL